MTANSDAAMPNEAADSNSPSQAAAQRKPRFALFIATACGLGYIPVAPGTFGSLAGLLLFAIPACLYFWGEIPYMLANAPVGDFFFKVPVGYFNQFVWTYLILLVLVSGWSLGRRTRRQILEAERSRSRRRGRSVGSVRYYAGRVWGSGVVEGSGTSICHRGARLHNHAVCAQLEIFASGFYTFSRIRYLEAVPSAPGRVASGWMGHNGRRLGGRRLRGDRVVDRARRRAVNHFP